MRWAFVILISSAASVASPVPGHTKGADAAASLAALVTQIRQSAKARDSLSSLIDTSTAGNREFLEELVWERDTELHASLMTAVDAIKDDQTHGVDVGAPKQLLGDAVREGWPRYLVQLKRRGQALSTLNRASEATTGAARLAIEADLNQQSERLVRLYESLVDEVLALEQVGIDAVDQRNFLLQGLPVAAKALVTRLQLASRDRSGALARLSRDASNADLRYEVEATDERLKRSTQSLSTAIDLMNRLHLETTDLRVDFIAMTGKLTADVFHWKVLVGLLKTLGKQLLDFLAGKAPQWLFQGLLIALTFLGFRALARLVKRGVRKAIGYSHLSDLMRTTIVRLSGSLIMLIGFVVILTQLGVQVAPLLAGFGIAGVVVGFAMQNTLSNFAAGGMILSNQPFDVGDEIEVAGVTGTVKRMTLVSTTILTGDNQTLIVPNSAVWGGVIRNRTTQPFRRVDLMFGIDYQDDVDKAERALRELVAAHEQVRKDPAPVVRLHQLADSSVNFVVRVWTTREHYWDVYWDLTRAVKLRFDQEGITIPFPQRQLHMTAAPGSPGGPAAPGAPRRES